MKRIAEYRIIDNNDLMEIQGKDVIIFGSGADGKLLFELQTQFGFKVVAFWDNGAKNEEKLGVPVYSFKKGLSKYNKGQIVIIASSRFGYQMISQLEHDKFEGEYYVWNYEQCNADIEAFIEHNSRLWEQKRKCGNSKVLIPFVPFHDIYFISHAYAGNYLAEKYDAEIWCYLRRDNYPEMAPKSVLRMYSAINVVGIIDERLTDKQKKKVDSITDSVWSGINTVEDWKKIKIYGIDFGTSIIREYMRFNVPSFSYKNEELREYLKRLITIIVFWQSYFEEVHDIKAVMLWDGVCYESFIRDIAIAHGIPVYAIHYTSANRCFLNSHFGYMYKNYDRFFSQLSDDEKKYGIRWAKKQLEARLKGDLSDITYMNKSVFSSEEVNTNIMQNGNIKILICPHSFADDIYGTGPQIFNDPFEWMCFLGELSNKTEYDWYIKKHPNSDARDEIIIDNIVKKYPRMKLIPKWTSPHQLCKEGIGFALTVFGTIGHEYPALGINVINAGNNPHMAFDFCVNPKTKEEYESVLLHLDKIKINIDMNEIYKFYCIHYLYYKAPNRSRYDVFFKEPEKFIQLKEKDSDVASMYKLYISDWNEEAHQDTQKKVEALFEELDNYDFEAFYKNDVSIV